MIVLLLSGGLSLLFTLFLTPVFVKGFQRLGWGQFIRQDGPKTHFVKRGTPTMGGIIILLGMVFGYFTAHLIGEAPPSYSSLLVIFIMLGLGTVGFIDDYSKIRRQQSLGLSPRGKVIGQILVSAIFAVLAISFPDDNGQTPASLAVSFIRDIDWLTFATFGLIGSYIAFIIWTSLIVVSTSNAVNLTDGLDGLAAGSSILVFGSYVLISFWQFNQSCFSAGLDLEVAYKCYEVRDPLDLAAVATAILASLIGFLWWNTSPAKIFMGDTGSLALGGIIAGLSVTSRTEILAVVLGALFVAEVTSVVVQILAFRTTGRRVFRMAPFHHHFELVGWAETTVIIRFWLLTAIACGLGVALFYGEWLSIVGA